MINQKKCTMKNSTIIRFAKFSVILLLILAQSLFSQQDQYKRKSITFVDYIVYKGVKEKVTADVEYQYLRKIKSQINLDRFDINNVPDKISRNIRNNIGSGYEMKDEVLIKSLESYLLPEISKILDIEKEYRARNFVDETEKNSFIAQKAKEIGVSADHMLEVMNSAYIFLPYISELKAKKHKKDPDDKKDKDKMSVDVKGGIIVYKINYKGDYSINKMSEVTSSAFGSETKGKNETWKTAKNKAFIKTAETLGTNLRIEIQKMESFQLKTQLRKVEGLHVQFPLGNREGLKLDHPYWVGEWRENKKGRQYFKKDGFVRIGKVADNKTDPNALSEGYVIHKGNWARGMTLVEHPTLGIDFAFKPRFFSVDVDSGFFQTEDEDFAMTFGNTSSDLFGMDFDLNINIAEQTKKLQSFLVIGGTISALPVEYITFYKNDQNPWDYYQPDVEEDIGLLYNGYIGYMRKTYLGRIALHREFLAAVQGFNTTVEWGDQSYDLNTIGFGGRVNLGLELALTINWNLGVFAGYRYFPGLDIWTAKLEDDEMDLETWGDTKFPKIKSEGPTYGIYLHYSIPSFGSTSTKFVEKAASAATGNMFNF